MVSGTVIGVLRMAGKGSGADVLGAARPRAHRPPNSNARGRTASGREGVAVMVEPPSGGLLGGTRTCGTVGQQVDADTVEPAAGAGRWVALTVFLIGV